jgi:16S rRNA (guanine966-N2)-methyltransferase
VTRIVAGVAGGRVLAVPPRGTRPTSDRVREALFSRLVHLDAVDGAHVVDLFAGSGALGLEAASRGAGDVVLVESSAAAVAVCRRNVETVGLPGIRVAADRVLPWLRRGAPAEPVDLALIDPPYDLPQDALGEVLAALSAHLAPDAVVVVERSSRTPEPIWPAHWHRFDERRYGETVVWFAEPRPPADHDAQP